MSCNVSSTPRTLSRLTCRRMSRLFAVVAISLLLPAAGLAQPTGPASRPRDAAMAAAYDMWQGQIRNIVAAAEEIGEQDYAYRPVASVRTIGELIGHVAGTQHLICAAVLGEPQPAEDAVEKSAKTKAALLQALRESTVHCDKAYAIAAPSASGEIELFGSKSTRIAALILNAVHDGEHYGNLVTYMRMKGLVPPSSRR